GCHAHYSGNIFRAGSEPSFLSAALNQRQEPYSLADIKTSYAFGAVELVSGEGEHVNVHFLNINRNMSHCLNSVGMENDAVLSADFAYLLNRLNGADFVVGDHDCYKGSVFSYSLLHAFGRNK